MMQDLKYIIMGLALSLVFLKTTLLYMGVRMIQSLNLTYKIAVLLFLSLFCLATSTTCIWRNSTEGISNGIFYLVAILLDLLVVLFPDNQHYSFRRMILWILMSFFTFIFSIFFLTLSSLSIQWACLCKNEYIE